MDDTLIAQWANDKGDYVVSLFENGDYECKAQGKVVKNGRLYAPTALMTCEMLLDQGFFDISAHGKLKKIL